MNYQNTRRGFTLIELLVVVLIIGILAAVALPQYKKAVTKSRVATILPILSSIIQAHEVYYLSNGQYTDNASLMDLQLPANCIKVENDTESGTWKCGADFLLDIDAGAVYASYCPKYNTSYTSCKSTRDFSVVFGASHLDPSNQVLIPNSRRCWKPLNSSQSDFGEEICKSLGSLLPAHPLGLNLYELY